MTLNRFAHPAGLARIAAAIQDPLNMAYDAKQGRLLILHAGAHQLLEVREDAAGDLDVGRLRRYDIRGFGLQAAGGMSVDPASGRLFILDQAGQRIVRVEPGSGGSFAGAVVTAIDLRASGLGQLRGLAFDAGTGHMQVVNPERGKLYELKQGGELVATRDLTRFHLSQPEGLVFAPSGDQTDAASQLSLYVADSGQAGQVEGKIVELSLVQPVAAGASDFQSGLVRTTNLAGITPPSDSICVWVGT